jgi:hemerythrin-like domain-containing protein
LEEARPVPVVIGGKPEKSFGDPIGLLIDCHRRIEHFLSVLAQISKDARGGPLTEPQRSALDNALRYFREAAPKHTADEEETLFPVLRLIGRSEVQCLLGRIDSLQAEHFEADKAHAEMDRLGQAWLTNGLLSQDEATHFADLAAELGELYRGHIAIEEGEVFPVAAGVLDTRQREAMGAEMAARRGLRHGK